MRTPCIEVVSMACRMGVERLKALFDQYGAEDIDLCFEHLLERCARALREVALPQIPDGEYPFEDFVELVGAVPEEPREFIRLKVTMIKEPDHVTFDFTGTDEQSLASINIAGDERFYKAVHRKQRHTAKRVFERLRDEHGFTGDYTIIKDYVRDGQPR